MNETKMPNIPIWDDLPVNMYYYNYYVDPIFPETELAFQSRDSISVDMAEQQL